MWDRYEQELGEPLIRTPEYAITRDGIYVYPGDDVNYVRMRIRQKRRRVTLSLVKVLQCKRGLPERGWWAGEERDRFYSYATRTFYHQLGVGTIQKLCDLRYCVKEVKFSKRLHVVDTFII